LHLHLQSPFKNHSSACHPRAKRRHSGAKRRIPAPVLALAAAVTVALAVARSFACHSGAKRRNLLLHLHLQLPFKNRSCACHPRAKRRIPAPVLALAAAVAVAFAVARSFACHSGAKRRNLLLHLHLQSPFKNRSSLVIEERGGGTCPRRLALQSPVQRPLTTPKSNPHLRGATNTPNHVTWSQGLTKLGRSQTFPLLTRRH